MSKQRVVKMKYRILKNDLFYIKIFHFEFEGFYVYLSADIDPVILIGQDFYSLWLINIELEIKRSLTLE